MQALKISLLGPVQVSLDGKAVETDRHKAIALLAYLAVEENACSRETLAALLWPDYPRASAFSYLRRTLWELNRMLGKGWIEADRESVRLVHSAGLTIDVEEFRRYITQDASQVEALEQAVRLVRGDFLEGLVVADTAPFEEWQTLYAESFKRDFAHVLERLVSALEEKKAYTQALPYAQRWLALDRLNEAAWRALMRQLAGLGDRSGVIRAHQECTQTLQDELNIAPQAETETVYQSIVQGRETPGQRGESGIARAAPTKHEAGNLPVPATPFVGREEEISQVTRLAKDPHIHLLTLTGPGGTGKTRLSIQVAAGMDGTFSDGVWFVPLAAVKSAQGIISAIAQGCNLTFYKGEESPLQQLLDYLREKRLLLVLDNFEHLLEGGRELVSEVLTAAPEVKLLVTSRERLNLQPEQIYRVRGMSIPAQAELAKWDHPEERAKAYSGIQLLEERARRVKAGFKVTRDNLNPILEICQLVDGSPLGIELAAAWLEVLPEEEIAQEIVRSLDFLQTDAVDTPERQRSLRMVFDTSWRLLVPEEQQAFRRLCVFRGDFSRQAAQEVSGASLRTLLSLANKSWLEQSDNGRYHLHEVLKQYGVERLQADEAEWRETKDQLAEFYCKLLEVQGKALETAQQIQALQQITPELESNIPDAWEWLLGKGRIQELIERMLPGLFHYWLVRGPSRDFLPELENARQAVPSADQRDTLLQQIILETAEINAENNLDFMGGRLKERLMRLWGIVNEQGLQDEMDFWYLALVTTYGSIIDFQECGCHLTEWLPRMSGKADSWEVGNFFLLIGWYTDFSKIELREKYFRKALDIFRKIGVIQEQGATLRALSHLAANRMDYELAIEYSLEAQALYEQVGDPIGIDSTWTNLGEYYLFLGKIEQAFHAFEELRHYSERTGNRRFLGTDLSWESLQWARYGKLERALELRQRSLDIAKEVGNQNDIAWATWELGDIYRLMGNIELAKKFYEEALPQFKSMQELIGLGFYHRGLGDLAMGAGDWQKAFEQYQQALAYHLKEQRSNRNWGLALTYSRLAEALVRLDRLEEAKHHLQSSLARAVSFVNPDLKTLPLAGIASWLAARGSHEKAIELAACVASKPVTWNEVKQHAENIMEEAGAALPAKEARRWKEQGEQMTVDEACKVFEGEIAA